MEPVGDGRCKCAKCGYVYDPAKGDTRRGVEPGTRFEELPDGWGCPRCRKGKDEFRPL